MTPDPAPLAALLAELQARIDIIRPDLEPEMSDSDTATFYLTLGNVRAAIAAGVTLARPAPDATLDVKRLREAMRLVRDPAFGGGFHDLRHPTPKEVAAKYAALATPEPADPIAALADPEEGR